VDEVLYERKPLPAVEDGHFVHMVTDHMDDERNGITESDRGVSPPLPHHVAYRSVLRGSIVYTNFQIVGRQGRVSQFAH